MLRDSQTDHKEMEIEEPIDIVLWFVSTTLDPHSHSKTHCELSAVLLR